jgi:hypothetical protein
MYMVKKKATSTAAIKITDICKSIGNADDLAPQNCSNRLVLEVWRKELSDAAAKAACTALIKKLGGLTSATTITQAMSLLRSTSGCSKFLLARKDLYRKRSYGAIHTRNAIRSYKYDTDTAKSLEGRAKQQIKRINALRKALKNT